MWLAGSESLDVFLGAHRFAVTRAHEVLHGGMTETAAEGLQAMEVWFSGRGTRSRVRLWLSGSLCRTYLQDRVSGATGRDLDRIAEVEAPIRTGLIAPCAVWTESWGGDKRAVVAVQAALLDDTLNWSKRMRGKVRLRSVRPWWSQALDAALAEGPECEVLVVDDQESLTILAGATELELAVSVAPIQDETEVASLRQRTLFGLGLEEAKAQCVRLGRLEPGGAPRECVRAAALGHWVDFQ